MKNKDYERDTGVCRVTAYLTPKIVERLEREATKRTMSRSLIIRLACEHYLQNESEVSLEVA